ncbi:DUF4357 domain-containing protein [Devosia rhizoryzae]|uniref:DUF4357 domain-containing protein n=1 Tax=Devosia rhizoryzae TaxID=2774137 RepID=A0ABX7C6Q9_9HYPH|nr:DUF4357 domain-containing protein [Devosia rhizoryzae]QQR38412.1 DUF4357 domain-containing protein [Devosia rhizoryzae]
MACAILGADRPAHNLASNDFPTVTPVPVIDGLVADPHLDLDSQIAILAAIDETGSAHLGDLMALLGDHPSPGQAIQALIREGALIVTTTGLLDAHSQVARRVTPPPRKAAAPSPQTQNKGVQHLKVVAPEPDIFFATGIDRGYFAREPRLRQRGIYLALYGNAVYVGRSGDTACRLAWGAHLRRNGLPDRIIAAVDKHQALDEAQTRTAERLAARMVIKHPDLTLLNALPAGERLAPDRYEATDRFVTAFFQRIERAGLLTIGSVQGFRTTSNTTLIETDEIEPAPEGHGAGQLFTMESCGVTANARIEDGKFWVLADSQVRRDPVPSAGRAALTDRQDLLHDGGLIPEDDHLVLTVDLAFDTLAGAGNFVAGSRVKPTIWRPLAHPAGIGPRP